jgi:hypothetical protein
MTICRIVFYISDYDSIFDPGHVSGNRDILSQNSGEIHTLLVLGFNLTMKHGFLLKKIKWVSGIMHIPSLILTLSSSASLRFFVYPDPKGSEEPTIPRKSGEELGAAKINLLPPRLRVAA